MRLELPNCVHLANAYMRECLDLKGEMSTKMAELPPDEFEGVLHPVFEADELKLILVGAVLGLCAGLFQSLVMFA